jgi:hypothetical protein
MCDIKTLCIKNQAHISQCSHCQTMYIWHSNLMLNFTPETFEEFREILFRQEFHDCCMLFPDGEERVIIHAPWRDLSFTFTYTELRDLKEAIDESLLMREVYALIR